jgi:hypothetical protein
MPECPRGQVLLQYLAQLEGLDYAVVDHNGRVTGLLRQFSGAGPEPQSYVPVVKSAAGARRPARPPPRCTPRQLYRSEEYS